MNTYIALFRGINVGGKNILPMADLARLLERLGFSRVQTYIQSGNVVFQSAKTPAPAMAAEISSIILDTHGFAPTIFLLNRREFQDAIDNNPFAATDGKALHFFFLMRPPQKPDLAGLTAVKAASEEFRLYKSVFYLHAPDGIGRSKLASKVEQRMGVPVTARNWNTVSKLQAMATQ